MTVEVRPATSDQAMYPHVAQGRPDTGVVTLRVQLPVGFASALTFAAHLRAPWRTESDVVEAVLRRALQAGDDR